MKKVLVVVIMLFGIIEVCQAQEPGNNLRKTVQELRLSFPDLVAWGEQNGSQNFKSPEANILFTVKKGVVCTEFTQFQGSDGFLRDFYHALVRQFSKNAKSYLWGNDKISISFFYSYFRVYISYTPYSDVALLYDLY